MTRIQKARRLVSKGGLALFENGLFAGVIFLLNVLLARWLTSTDYGAFAIAYSVFLLFTSLHSGIITEPLVVFGAGRYVQQFRAYLGIVIRGHFAVAALGSLLLIVAAISSWSHSRPIALAFWGLAFSAPLILLLWVLRYALYVRLEPGWAAIGGSIYLVFVIAAISSLWVGRNLPSPAALLGCSIESVLVVVLVLVFAPDGWIRWGGVLYVLILLAVLYLTALRERFSAALPFLAMGIGATAVSALFLIHLRPRWNVDGSIRLREVAERHWLYGRWILASAILDWQRANIYYSLLPIWLGLSGAGTLRALTNISLPASSSLNALSLLLSSMLVRDRVRGGRDAMNRTMKVSLAVFLAVSAAYLILLLAFRSFIFRFLYSGKYESYSLFSLILVGLIPFAVSMDAVIRQGFHALERSGTIFWAQLVSAIAGLGIGIPLTALTGLNGALIGQLCAYVVSFTIMIVIYSKLSPDAGVHSL